MFAALAMVSATLHALGLLTSIAHRLAKGGAHVSELGRSDDQIRSHA